MNDDIKQAENVKTPFIASPIFIINYNKKQMNHHSISFDVRGAGHTRVTKHEVLVDLVIASLIGNYTINGLQSVKYKHDI